MGINVVSNESSLAITVESSEGTYVAPSSAADFVEISEPATFDLERESVERALLSTTVETEAARVGLKSVSGSYKTELRANSTAGGIPVDLDRSLRSLLGGRRQISAQQTSGSTHTSTVINFANTSAFSVGDIVLVREAGQFEVRPISAITTNTSITLAFALDNGAPSNGVVVEKVTMYYPDSTNAVTLSSTYYYGGEIDAQAVGLRSSSMSLEGWSTGSFPQVTFNFAGLNVSRADAAPSYSPDANSAVPPIILGACAWINGTMVHYNDFTLNIENTIADVKSACSQNGKISSRITNLKISGSINPWMEDDDVARYNLFNNNTNMSLFLYAYEPSGVTGEFSQVVSFWIPQAKITSMPAVDQDGIYADAIEFTAHRSSGNDSLFMGFI